MIEQSFYYEDSIIKEITSFFKSRVENLKLRDKKEKCFASSKKKNRQKNVQEEEEMG